MKTPPLRILLVDDEPANLRLLERTLEVEGHLCVGAESGEAAIDVFHAHQFDIVLMDVMLPGMSGYETAVQLRKLREHWFPIIFISALSEPYDIIAALDAGGDDYLAKPFDVEVLLARLGALHRIASSQRLAQEQSVQLRRYYEASEREKLLTQRLFVHLRRDDQLAESRADVASISADGPSGDLLAVQEAPDGRTQLLIADASGHGLVAGTQLFPLVELFHHLASSGFVMPTIVARASALLKAIIPGGSFISACFVTVDAHAQVAEVWNMGMPDALLLEPDGTVVHRFPSRFLPLGIEALVATELEPEWAAVRPRQRLFLHSDGLIEASNRDGVQFGAERLAMLLPDIVSHGAGHALKSLEEFLDGIAPGDDVTVCLHPVPLAPWAHLRERPSPLPEGWQTAKWHAEGARLAVGLGVFELSQPDPVADLMAVLRSVANIGQRDFRILFTVVWKLVRNAVDWGVLALPPDLDDLSRKMERWRRLRARTGDAEQGIDILITAMTNERGDRCWEVRVTDSGDGFDVTAWRRRLTRSEVARWGGLDIVEALCGPLEFSAGGASVRALVPAGHPAGNKG